MTEAARKRDDMDAIDEISTNLSHARAILVILVNDWQGTNEGGSFGTPNRFIFESLHCVMEIVGDTQKLFDSACLKIGEVKS